MLARKQYFPTCANFLKHGERRQSVLHVLNGQVQFVSRRWSTSRVRRIDWRQEEVTATRVHFDAWEAGNITREVYMARTLALLDGEGISNEHYQRTRSALYHHLRGFRAATKQYLDTKVEIDGQITLLRYWLYDKGNTIVKDNIGCTKKEQVRLLGVEVEPTLRTIGSDVPGMLRNVIAAARIREVKVKDKLRTKRNERARWFREHYQWILTKLKQRDRKSFVSIAEFANTTWKSFCKSFPLLTFWDFDSDYLERLERVRQTGEKLKLEIHRDNLFPAWKYDDLVRGFQYRCKLCERNKAGEDIYGLSDKPHRWAEAEVDMLKEAVAYLVVSQRTSGRRYPRPGIALRSYYSIPALHDRLLESPDWKTFHADFERSLGGVRHQARTIFNDASMPALMNALKECKQGQGASWSKDKLVEWFSKLDIETVVEEAKRKKGKKADARINQE